MASLRVFVLILVTIVFHTGLVSSQTNKPQIYTQENPVPVGSNVTLFSTDSVTKGVWLFNTELIVIIMPGDSITSNSWSSRITFNSTSSSLTVRSLTVSDSGVYTLNAINVFSAQLNLSVQVPISNVTVTAGATDLVEFNDSAVFTCSIGNGSLPAYVWMNGSSELTAGGNIQLSNGSTSLTIVNVTRYDTGPFTCNVSNGVSDEVSPPVFLNISYGPSNTDMMIEPTAPNHIYRTGSNISLMCSVESRPPATIRWTINDVYLNLTGPRLQLENATVNNSAKYKCLFYNSVTLRFSSASVDISIMEPLEVAVLRQPNELPIMNKKFFLSCEVRGTVASFRWWRNGQLISSGNDTLFTNRTLSFNPVQQSDSGIYRCQAFNAVSNVTSNPLELQVNYGPEMPTITGPDAALTGENITLTCNASSYPESTYTWFFNGSLVANASTYVTPPLTTNMTGIYTCIAYNDITGLNRTANKTLTVLDRIKEVRVTAPDDVPIEGAPYTLTCSVIGPADHVFWMKNCRPLPVDSATHISMMNTIHFDPLEQNDTGHYQCVAMNAAENMTSHSYSLIVNFGPETPIVEGPDLAEIGTSAVFSCSAFSEPSSEISWWFNGTLLSNTSLVIIDQLSFNMSGNYTCKAFNNVTELTRTNTIELKVIGNLTVEVKTNMIPINSNNFTLICDITGPYDSIYWMKDHRILNTTHESAGNMSYRTENNMLYFSPVTTSDDGVYQCVATNVLTHQPSPPYNLLVNYGPLNVTITGPDSAPLNTNVSLTCSADSVPTCGFQWYFNGGTNSSVVVGTGPILTFTATDKTEGNYTCVAWNSVTNITMSNIHAFTAAVPGQACSFHFQTHGGLMFLFTLSLFVLFN